LDQRPSIIIVEVSGKDARKIFANESGGHRWQRIPSTEKRGRVQTSTITVAILEPVNPRDLIIDDGEISKEVFRGSGAGGQKRNKTSSAVRLTHKPTGIVVKYESERSQSMNLQAAKAILASRLKQLADESDQKERSSIRKEQLGCGMRGEKRRTIRIRDDQVIDHITQKKISAKKYLRGELDELF